MKYDVSESTIRWNYNQLKEMNLVIESCLTKKGQFILGLLNGQCGVMDSIVDCGASGPGSNPGTDPERRDVNE